MTSSSDTWVLLALVTLLAILVIGFHTESRVESAKASLVDDIVDGLLPSGKLLDDIALPGAADKKIIVDLAKIVDDLPATIKKAKDASAKSKVLENAASKIEARKLVFKDAGKLNASQLAKFDEVIKKITDLQKRIVGYKMIEKTQRGWVKNFVFGTKYQSKLDADGKGVFDKLKTKTISFRDERLGTYETKWSDLDNVPVTFAGLMQRTSTFAKNLAPDDQLALALAKEGVPDAVRVGALKAWHTNPNGGGGAARPWADYADMLNIRLPPSTRGSLASINPVRSHPMTDPTPNVSRQSGPADPPVDAAVRDPALEQMVVSTKFGNKLNIGLGVIAVGGTLAGILAGIFVKPAYWSPSGANPSPGAQNDPTCETMECKLKNSLNWLYDPSIFPFVGTGLTCCSCCCCCLCLCCVLVMVMSVGGTSASSSNNIF